MCRLAQDMVLPVPLHQFCLSFCRVAVLLYACDLELSHTIWRALGSLHTFLLILIIEFCEEGSSASLYYHGLTHCWELAWLPISVSDESGEADIRMSTRFSRITTTDSEDSIRDCLGHELYMKFVSKRKSRNTTHLWRPPWRPIVMECCVVSASVVWRANFLVVISRCQDVHGLLVLMDTSTESVRVRLQSASDPPD